LILVDVGIIRKLGAQVARVGVNPALNWRDICFDINCHTLGCGLTVAQAVGLGHQSLVENSID